MSAHVDSDVGSVIRSLTSKGCLELTSNPVGHMMRAKDGLKRIADAISRRKDVAAVLVPRSVAMALVDEMYPPSALSELGDAFDLAVDKARDKYMRLVSEGGYIGTVLSVPMVVADDVVVCPLTEQELTDSAVRLGVDMHELYRNRCRAGAA